MTPGMHPEHAAGVQLGYQMVILHGCEMMRLDFGYRMQSN